MGSQDVLYSIFLVLTFCSRSLTHFYPDPRSLEHANVIYPSYNFFDGCNYCWCGFFGRPVVCTRKTCASDVHAGPPMHVPQRFRHGGFVIPNFQSQRKYQQKNTEHRPSEIKRPLNRFRNINTHEFNRIPFPPLNKPILKPTPSEIMRSVPIGKVQLPSGKSAAHEVTKPIITKYFHGQRMSPYLKGQAGIQTYGDSALATANRDKSMLLVTPSADGEIKMSVFKERIKTPKIWIRSMAHGIKDKSKTSAVWIQIIPQNPKQTMTSFAKDDSIPQISDIGIKSKHRIQKFDGQTEIVTIDAQSNKNAETPQKPPQSLAQTLLTRSGISPRLM